jgi:hypothetical protein
VLFGHGTSGRNLGLITHRPEEPQLALHISLQ